jgi:hypothetical protein
MEGRIFTTDYAEHTDWRRGWGGGHVTASPSVGCARGARWDAYDFFLSVGIGVVIMGSRRMGCFGVGRRKGLLRFIDYVSIVECRNVTPDSMCFILVSGIYSEVIKVMKSEHT